MDKQQHRSTRAFRSSIPVVLAWAVVACVFATILVSLALWRRPVRPVPMLAVCAAASAAVTLVILFFPVYVRPDALFGHNAFGVYHLLPWSAVAVVRPVNLFGLKYLILADADSKRTVWVPLFLADMRGFTRAVRERAGDAHPLAHALARYSG